MPHMYRTISALALVLCLSSVSTVSTQSTMSTEILWDRYGVPHIFAPDAEMLFYAFGWAQMQAHGDLYWICAAIPAAGLDRYA